MEVGEASVTGETDSLLPSRLFATDRYPSKRLNVYSRIEMLLLVRDLLKGTEEWDVIRNSCFKKLFELPAERCSVSCKLIHALLTRTLVTRKKYVIWSVFGGQPFRFALRDFETVTGLPCGDFPEEYDPESQMQNKDIDQAYWDKLVGLPRQATLNDIVQHMRSAERMSGWRRIRLALILIVDGVLVAAAQNPRPTPKYVKLTENVHEFLDFPWGRESFLWTLSSMKPGKKVPGKIDNPVGAYCQQLQQESFRLVGFPLALQLVALDAIPLLLGKLSPCKEAERLVDYPGNKLPPKAVTTADVLDVERMENLTVNPFTSDTVRDEEWDDEIRDRKVTYRRGKGTNLER